MIVFRDREVWRIVFRIPREMKNRIPGYPEFSP